MKRVVYIHLIVLLFITHNLTLVSTSNEFHVKRIIENFGFHRYVEHVVA